MTPIRHALYLHGFASSPASSKALRFERELGAHGIGLSCPDFNLPSFETLTVTRMLEQTCEAIAAAPDGPIALIGSSLGGFVALLASAADVTGRVDRLILLAPALDFGGNRLRQLGDEGIEAWRRKGRLRVFHYGLHEERDVGFALYQDAAHYDALSLTLRTPALTFQGRYDTSVHPAMVEQWARTQPLVTLRMLDDGHQLIDSMDTIWEESRALLGVASTGI